MIPMDELLYILMRRSDGHFRINGELKEMSWLASSEDSVEMWFHDPFQMSKPIRSYNFNKVDICALIKNQRLVGGSYTCELSRSRW